MSTEAYYPAKPGDPILAETWNRVQTTVRDAIDDLNTKLVGKLSVTGLDTSGPVKLTGPAVIQRGATALPEARPNELGLYATDPNSPIRFTTHNADIKFFGDGGVGSIANLTITALGDATLRGNLTANNGLTAGAGIRFGASGVIHRGGAPLITATTDLGLYCTLANQPIRLVTTNADVRFYGDGGAGATPNLTVAAAGDATLRGRLTANNGLTVNTGATAINGGLTVSSGGVQLGDSGVLQRGGAAITATKDLGLYSTLEGHWIRMVTNRGPIRFFSDGDKGPAGTTPNLAIEPNGDATLRGRFTANNGLTVTTGAAAINSGLTVAGGLTVTTGATAINGGLTVSGGLAVTGPYGLGVNGGGLSVNGGTTNINSGLTVAGGLTVTTGATVTAGGLAVAGGLTVTTGATAINGGLTVNTGVQLGDSGVVQRGGAAITATKDLGLYSTLASHWIRMVTNQGPVKFFSDGNQGPAGTTPNLAIEPNGDVMVRGNLTVGGRLLGGEATFPDGIIMMWNGDMNNIPSGWLLCNGQPGTRNLLGTFPIPCIVRRAR